MVVYVHKNIFDRRQIRSLHRAFVAFLSESIHLSLYLGFLTEQQEWNVYQWAWMHFQMKCSRQTGDEYHSIRTVCSGKSCDSYLDFL